MKTNDSFSNGIGVYRSTITRVCMCFYLFVILWRWYAHLLPFQLLSPPLTLSNMNATFWLYKLSPLQSILVAHYQGSIIFSLLLIAACKLVFLFPLQRIFTIVLFASFFLYGLIYPINICFASHYMAGIILMNFVFLASRNRIFELLWEGLRYYTCWLYFSAFLWKIVNGAFFQSDFGEITFKRNLAWYLVQNSDSLLNTFYRFFIQNSFLLNWGDKGIFLLEGIFLIGFFTKKFDKLLLALMLFIHLITYLFSDALFFEVCILSLTFLSPKFWELMTQNYPFFNRSIKLKE